MIREIKVKGINGNKNYSLSFHEDINVITGKNGSGKTTLLKLMWYLISGNIERALEEIDFKSVSLKADDYEISISIAKNEMKNDIANIQYTIGSNKKSAVVLKSQRRVITMKDAVLPEEFDDVDDVNVLIAKASKQSIFFPTFRRIEGGFSISGRGNRIRSTNFEESFNRISDHLSVRNHKFIASVSTSDIVTLLTERYADISDQTNKLHNQLTSYIEEQLKFSANRKDNQSDRSLLNDANKVLDSIHNELNEVTVTREKLLKPFTILSQLIEDVFQHKGIKVTNAITLGQAKEAMFSDQLSAGEKQMLSFLCYNAFSENCPIFIDEPEISLHVDWQRTLFPTLMAQSQNNQFFIATHSPFIYSKYSDKEVLLNDDRGGY